MKSKVAVLVLVVVASCGDGGQGDPGEQSTDLVVAIPFEFTHLLGPEAMSLLAGESEQGVLEFVGTSDELDAIAAGEVVVGGVTDLTPNGLLRRVDAVDRDGEVLRLETSPIPIIYAFRRLDVRVDRAGPADVSSFGTLEGALSVSVSKDVTFSHDVDWAVFDGDGDPKTTEDRVLVSGLLTGTVGFTFELGFDWGSVEGTLGKLLTLDIGGLLTDIGFHTKFVAKLGAGADVDVVGQAALSFEKSVPLGDPVPLGVLWIPPLVLTPQIYAEAGITGGATAKLAAHAKVEATMELGVEVKGLSIKPIGGVPKVPTPEASASIQATAEVKAWVHPRVELLIYGVVGPTIGLMPYLRIDADTRRDPCWEASVGVDATLGLTLGIGPLKLIDEHTNIELAQEPVADGSCPLPPGDDVEPLDPLFDPWSRSYEGSMTQTGTWDDVLSITRVHDNRLVVTSGTAAGLLKVDGEGPPVWGRAYHRVLAEPVDPFDLETRLAPHRVVPAIDGGLHVLASRGVVMHTDAAGHPDTTRVLDVANHRLTRIGDARLAADHGFWLAGDTPVADVGVERDGFVARFDKAGALLWTQWITGPEGERPTAIVVAPDGGAWVVGYAQLGGHDSSWIARFDAAGQPLWVRRLLDCTPHPAIGPQDIVLRAAVLTEDGDLALAGRTFYPNWRSIHLKVKPDGAVPWSRSYTTQSVDLGLDVYALSQLETGGYLIAGVRVGITQDDAVLLAATDASGHVDWARAYHGGVHDTQTGMLRTLDDRGVLLAAATESFVSYPGGLWIAKVPRKDGLIGFAAGSDAVLEQSVAIEEVAECWELSEPAQVSVVPASATLVPYTVVTEDLAVTSVEVAP